MKHLAFVVIALGLAALACYPPADLGSTATPSATAERNAATPEPGAAASATPGSPTITTTPGPSPTAAATLELATATSEATATPAPVPMPAGYVIDQQATIGTYQVEVWRNTAADSPGYDSMTTIFADGQAVAQVGASSATDISGRDVTGEGEPDVVIETFSGGAHCCFSTVIYNLGASATKVLETRPSNCGGSLEDLNGDGVQEFSTCDDILAYAYCPYAASPTVRAVLAYQPGQGYGPASPQFAALYDEDIAAHTAMAQGAQPEGMGEWDGSTKCAVLPLVLDYLYSGRADQAWHALEQTYAYPDRLLLWAEVVRSATASSVYVAAGPVAEVSLPEAYMLQLLTSCGAGEQQVGFVAAGQDPCGGDVPRRDLYWLEAELRNIGLMSEGETLSVAPEGCADDCRLDVVTAAGGERLASIRLDTAVGFPGAVYRVNGAESAHWRLHGDLGWERLPD